MDIWLAMLLSIAGFAQVTHESHQLRPGDVIYWNIKKLCETCLKLHALALFKHQWISGRFPLTSPDFGLSLCTLISVTLVFVSRGCRKQ